MTSAYVVSGTIKDGTTVVLDEPLPVPGGRVRVTIEVLAPPPVPAEALQEFVDRLHRQRAANGVPPLSDEQIQAWVDDIRTGRGN